MVEESSISITATVLGGNGDEDPSSDPNKRTCYVSRLNELKEFYMKLGFIITGNDDNAVQYIISQDVTEVEQGFLQQEECIRQVWGRQCEVIYNDCIRLKEKYERFMGGIDLDTKRILATAAQNKILWIQDKNKTEEMCSIAMVGDFSAENYLHPPKEEGQIKQRDLVNDGNEKAFYLVKVPSEKGLCEGFELLNWVKTIICFKYPLNDQNMNFCIKKDFGFEDDTKFIAPDFTWYFSPPVKSFINYEASSVEVRWKIGN